MVSLVFLALLAGAHEPPERCSVSYLRNNPEGYVWPLERVRGFVASAEVIVRARADSMSDVSAARSKYDPRTDVYFTVIEVLRGAPPAELKIGGELVARDDYNTGAVPYRMVRPSGQRGSCHTYEYRQGAEYLLILRTAPHVIPLIAEAEELRLHPYWAPLAPLNEQVRGADDPWVKWVKSNLQPGGPGVGTAQADSVVLTRRQSYFRTGLAYRVRVSRDGAVHLETRMPNDSGRVVTSSIEPALAQDILARGLSLGLDGLPLDIMGTAPYCRVVATDAPSVVLGVYGPGVEHRVIDYLGCFERNDESGHGIIRKLRLFESALDSAAGVGQLIGRRLP